MIWGADGNVLIAEYVSGRVIRVDPATWQTVEVYNAPSGVDSMATCFGICEMSNGTIVVASNTAKKIIGIHPENKTLEFEIDPTLYGGTSSSMRGVFELEPGLICWADYTNQLMYATSVGGVEVQHQVPTIPTGWELDLTTWAAYIDHNTFVATVDASEIESKIVTQNALIRKSV